MANGDTTHNPHDRLFRETFAHTESLCSFVRAYGPPGVAALIDRTSFQPWPGTFVDPELGMYHSDIVYRFRIEDRPSFLYLLFEHQSTPAADMAFRMLKYLTRLWEDIEKKEPSGKYMPPVLAMVLYHGYPRWNAPREFQDLVDPPDGLTLYTPCFEYLLVDLNDVGVREKVDDLRCRFVLHLMHAAATDTLLEVFRTNGPVLERLWRSLATGDNLAFLETIIRYAVSVADVDARALQEIVVEHVNKEAGEIVMTTTAERWMEEGKIKGEIALLQRLIEQKFPDGPPVDLEGLSLAQLEEIGRRILICDTLDEVLDGLA